MTGTLGSQAGRRPYLVRLLSREGRPLASRSSRCPHRGGDLRARDVAGSEALSLSSDRSLRDVAQMMAEHVGIHLVVLNRANGRPVGILSSTDVIGALSATARTGVDR